MTWTGKDCLKENVTLAHQTYANEVTDIAHLSASVNILAWVHGKLWVEIVDRTFSQKTSLLFSTHPHSSLALCPLVEAPEAPRTSHLQNSSPFQVLLPHLSSQLGQRLCRAGTVPLLHHPIPACRTWGKAASGGPGPWSPNLLSLPSLNNPALHWGSIPFYPTTACPLPPPPGPFGRGILGSWVPRAWLRKWGDGPKEAL